MDILLQNLIFWISVEEIRVGFLVSWSNDCNLARRVTQQRSPKKKVRSIVELDKVSYVLDLTIDVLKLLLSFKTVRDLLRAMLIDTFELNSLIMHLAYIDTFWRSQYAKM